MAKSRDIAVIAAPLSADCCLKPGVVAETLDQLGRIGKRHSAMDEGTVHGVVISRRPFRYCGQRPSTRR
jgi:hypothetical protein